MEFRMNESELVKYLNERISGCGKFTGVTMSAGDFIIRIKI